MQLRGTQGRQADCSDHLAPLETVALTDRQLEQVAVEAEALHAVVEDDEVPEAAKRAGEGDQTVVDRVDLRALRRRDLDGARQRRRPRAHGAPAGDSDGPVEVASEGPDGQRSRVDADGAA